LVKALPDHPITARSQFALKKLGVFEGGHDIVLYTPTAARMGGVSGPMAARLGIGIVEIIYGRQRRGSSSNFNRTHLLGKACLMESLTNSRTSCKLGKCASIALASQCRKRRYQRQLKKTHSFKKLFDIAAQVTLVVSFRAKKR